MLLLTGELRPTQKTSITSFDPSPKRLRIFKLLSKQCCGAGAGGAEIILGPGAGAGNKF